MNKENVSRSYIFGIKEEILAYKLCRKVFKEIRKSTFRGSKIIKVLQHIEQLIKIQERNLQLLLQDPTSNKIFLHQTMGSLKAFHTVFCLTLLEFSLFDDEDDDFGFLPTLISKIDEDDNEDEE